MIQQFHYLNSAQLPPNFWHYKSLSGMQLICICHWSILQLYLYVTHHVDLQGIWIWDAQTFLITYGEIMQVVFKNQTLKKILKLWVYRKFTLKYNRIFSCFHMFSIVFEKNINYGLYMPDKYNFFGYTRMYSILFLIRSMFPLLSQ